MRVPVEGRVLVLLVPLVAGLLTQSSEALRNVKIGDPLPPFTVHGLDGQTYDLAGCKGNVTLIVFVRPDQPGSLTALTTVQALYGEAEKDKLVVLAVSSDENAGDHFRQIASRHGITYPITLDPKRKMYGDFGLVVTPTTLLVDPKGILRFELPHLPPDYGRSLEIHLELLQGKIDQATHDQRLTQVSQGRDAWNNSFQTRLAFAKSQIGRGQHERALETLLALRQERDVVQIAAELATVYLALERPDDAATCLAPYQTQKPLSPLLYVPLARLATHRGNDDQAEKYLQDALRLTPKKGPILFELGRLFERRGDCERAVTSYRQALEEVYGEGG